MPTKNNLISELRSLTVTGREITLVQTESIGTGAFQVNTYNFNGLFRTGRKTFDKFDVPFYVSGEGTPSENAAPKGDKALEDIFRAELSIMLDQNSSIKMYNILKMDAGRPLRTALVAAVREDPQNAGKYTNFTYLVQETAPGTFAAPALFTGNLEQL